MFDLLLSLVLPAALASGPNLPRIDPGGLSFSQAPVSCINLMTQNFVRLPHPGETAYAHYRRANAHLEAGEEEAAVDAMLQATRSVDPPLRIPAERFLLQWMRLNHFRRLAREVSEQLLEHYTSDGHPTAHAELLFERIALHGAVAGANRNLDRIRLELERVEETLAAGRMEAADRLRFLTWLGDWWTRLDEPVSAADAYRRAWLTIEEEGGDPTAQFGSPWPLCPGAMLSRGSVRFRQRDLDWLEYGYEATIKADGHVSEIRFYHNPHGSAGAGAALTGTRFALFRPAMVDGRTVATEDYRFRRVAYLNPDVVLLDRPLIRPDNETPAGSAEGR